jgi:hypothetical protein
MSPIFQALITLAIRILLGLLFLCQMPLAISNHLTHVIDIVLFVLAWVFVGIVLQDGDNLTSRLMSHCLSTSIIFGPARRSGVLTAEPVLELFSTHIDDLVEFPFVCSVARRSDCGQVFPTHSITVSLSFTILLLGDEEAVFEFLKGFHEVMRYK